ncbi:MAG: putative rane protein [Candidatus Binatus sp.]|nr:putative rane protein [Candidatus Binatus sp.]
MDPTSWIAFWAVLFLGTHLLISSSAVRPRLVVAVGEQLYRGIYSIAAFATLGPLIYEFAYHKHSGPLLWYLRNLAPIRWLAWLLMLAAFIFFVASLINPNPASLGAPANRDSPTWHSQGKPASGLRCFLRFWNRAPADEWMGG